MAGWESLLLGEMGKGGLLDGVVKVLAIEGGDGKVVFEIGVGKADVTELVEGASVDRVAIRVGARDVPGPETAAFAKVVLGNMGSKRVGPQDVWRRDLELELGGRDDEVEEPLLGADGAVALDDGNLSVVGQHHLHSVPQSAAVASALHEWAEVRVWCLKLVRHCNQQYQREE